MSKIIKANFIDCIDLYAKIKYLYRDTAILESLGAIDKETAQYTIIGVIRAKKLSGKNGNFIVEDFKLGKINVVDLFTELNAWINLDNLINLNNHQDGYLSPLQLGCIGYFSYDVKHYCERLDKTIINDVDSPEVYLIKYSLLFVYNRLKNEAYWVADESISLKRINDLEDRIKNTKIKKGLFLVNNAPEKNFTKEMYLNAVNKTIKYIEEGDIFQANITMRFAGEYAGDPFELYKKLRQSTPNPFFSYLDFNYPVISTSPERFFKIKGKKISTNPIKGTVKCKIDGKDQREVLLNNSKDRAENIMIVDLLRNDIGRFCVQGSIVVKDLCKIKQFNNIYHLESIIEGTMKSRVRFSDVLKALFPGGSITGAPKIRSMNIIEELEFTPRNLYTGMIGFFGLNGYIDTNIAIRTIYFDKGRYFYHTGGGITINSNPDEEYKELILKAAKIEETIQEFIQAE